MLVVSQPRRIRTNALVHGVRSSGAVDSRHCFVSAVCRATVPAGILIVQYKIAGLCVMEATGNEINLLSGRRLLPSIRMLFLHFVLDRKRQP